MKFAVEVAPGGIIYIPSFMTIGSGIQVILRSVPQQFETLQCWYYLLECFVKYAVGIASGGMIFIPSFIKIGSGVQKSLGGGIHTRAHTHTQQDDLISLFLFFYFQSKEIRLKMGRNKIICENMYSVNLARDKVQKCALLNTVMNLQSP
jgi:hypothetical protein